MERKDPLRGFRFLLEIDEIASGGFTRVKGLVREVKHESYREGGVVEYEHKLLTQVSYPVLVLERGLALDDLWQWALAAADGDVKRKTVRIRLQDEMNDKAWAWQISRRHPGEVGDLRSRRPDVAGRHGDARARASRPSEGVVVKRPRTAAPFRLLLRARAAAAHIAMRRRTRPSRAELASARTAVESDKAKNRLAGLSRRGRSRHHSAPSR